MRPAQRGGQEAAVSWPLSRAGAEALKRSRAETSTHPSQGENSVSFRRRNRRACHSINRRQAVEGAKSEFRNTSAVKVWLCNHPQMPERPPPQLAHDRVDQPLLVHHAAVGDRVDQAALALEELGHRLVDRVRGE